MSGSRLLFLRTVLSQRFSSSNSIKISSLANQRFCSSAAESQNNNSNDDSNIRNNDNDRVIEDFDGRPSSDPVAAAFFSPPVQVYSQSMTAK
jgi:hypothetical protein